LPADNSYVITQASKNSGASMITIALIYDFDNTLSTKAMQDYAFIPSLNMSPENFWSEVRALVKEQDMDQILAYMYMMIKKTVSPIKRDDIVALGKSVEFFSGVEDWFERINAFAGTRAIIEHYVISSGLREIIEGTSIYPYFKKVYGSQFHYDTKTGEADWPLWAINYTAKTQFLFRINKGALELSDNEKVNNYMPESERYIPFERMIYIGDGFTDVPCMKLVKINGGTSICVYDKDELTAKNLLETGRVNFIAEADFTESGSIERYIKTAIDMMVFEHNWSLHKKDDQ
jgi:2-hydroxy-3-keto-5-methylthiopentenyl-1-phosphate phosphatase